MTDIYTARDLVKMMLDASRELNDAQRELELRTHNEAQADHAYRLARSKAYLRSEGTVGEREAIVDQHTAEERHAAKLAEGLSRSALEAVRNKRTQLSVLQTVSNAWKEEAAYQRTGPHA